MSPDITSVVRPPVIPPAGAARILTDSLNAAHAVGITVSTAPDLGVHCVSMHPPQWRLDPRAHAVSVLGAVLLIQQPPMADADSALAHVLGSRVAFHIGIEDGCSGADTKAGTLKASDRQLYLDGFLVGVQLRTLIATVPCEFHRRRYPRGERCPECAAAVPALRLATETTRRLDLETPRSLIAGLLASLTPSQVLEAVADDFRSRRGGPVTPREAIDLDQAEAMLRELAIDFELPDGEEG